METATHSQSPTPSHWLSFDVNAHGFRFVHDSTFYTHPGAKDLFPKQASFLNIQREKIVDLVKMHKDFVAMRSGISMIVMPNEGGLEPGEIMMKGFRGDFCKLKPAEREAHLDELNAEEIYLSDELTKLLKRHFHD